jgi:hypothetical protein
LRSFHVVFGLTAVPIYSGGNLKSRESGNVKEIYVSLKQKGNLPFVLLLPKRDTRKI